ncbi:MAG: hypothetical protein HYX74_04515 [Acidobacteria bacterium]|nr:hypothetical protein [Acidobacteriota bacterium]
MRISKPFGLSVFSCLLAGATLFLPAQQSVSSEQKASVTKAITGYVQQDQQLKGAFLIKDKKAAAVRELKFDHIHSGVEKREDGGYVACVDFKEGNQVLDLDFYLKPAASGELQVSDIRIHKIDGKDVRNQ